MPPPSVSPDLAPIPLVTLAELPALSAGLASKVRTSGFSPDVVVYVERGARLLAYELCQEFGCGAIPVHVARRGNRLKGALTGLVRRLPTGWRDQLRQFDQRWMWSRAGGAPRLVTSPFHGSLTSRHVLLVDDAADSGRTIAGCLRWLGSRGATREHVHIAVLAATTPDGRRVADSWLLARNTRLPWSSDSSEKPEADSAWRHRQPPSYR